MTKKILIISSVSAALFIVLSFGYSRAKFSSTQSHNSADQTQTTVSQPQEQAEMVDSQGGVDVSVDEVKRADGQTVLSLGINNHVEDYSQVDLQARSELAGVKPVKYIVDNAASGGHHVSSQLIFSGNLSGLLTIRLTNDLVFSINVK